MKRYLIIADDFTGANDTGVQLCRRGMPTNVYLHGDIPDNSISAVIDTESRAVSASQAKAKLHDMLTGLDFSRFTTIVKKVDSTLRGNIAVEVRAVDAACGSELVIFAPAFPDLGRTTKDGVHHLHGVPIKSTELACDPQNPVQEDHLVRLLETAYPEGVRHVPLQQIRAGHVDFRGGRVFACDAETNADLAALITTARSTGKKILWVGTAAMADNLLEASQKTRPALAVAASLSSVTRTQVGHAVASGAALVPVYIYEVLEHPELAEDYVQQAASLLHQGRDVILAPSSACGEGEYEKNAGIAATRGLSGADMSAFTREQIGHMTRAILRQCVVSGLFITGGDTAIGFFRKTDTLGSHIMEEVATGIPLMRLVGGEYDGMKVITKAGAFGKDDAITYALRKLKETRTCDSLA